MKIKGKLFSVLPARSGSSNGKDWKSQSFVLTCMDGSYERKVCFDMFGEERIDRSLINESVPGTEFEVEFFPESREYNGKWFTNIKAISVVRT